MISLFPQAILHVDADAFFASVEQVLHPHLQGKPIITGAERGMVIALSYEAKTRGVRRSMTVGEAKKICPELLAVPSDYEAYALFSQKMFSIMRRFTPQVEEYSIDEAFADIAGLRRLYRCSYPQIAENLKQEIQKSLGLTVSVGLSLTKSLAKLASKAQKPDGLTIVSGRDLDDFLKKTPIGEVWGFGKNSEALLKKHGVRTAFDFVQRPQSFAQTLLGKIGSEIWQELRGHLVHPVNSSPKTTYGSISKFHTFTPPQKNREFVFSQLLCNLENAVAKMRRFHLATNRVVITLRLQRFEDTSVEIKLPRHTTSVLELVHPVKNNFDPLFKSQTLYRATGVVLCDLKEEAKIQLTLFENPADMTKAERVSGAIDEINKNFGSRCIRVAESMASSSVKNNRLIYQKL